MANRWDDVDDGELATPASINDRLNALRKGDVFNVKAYDAVGDGSTVDTSAIQSTITAAVAAGGGTVLVPPGTYITSTLTLGSNIHLFIAPGATLKHRPGVAAAPILTNDLANGNSNIAVTGGGVIDGNASNVLAAVSDGQIIRFGNITNVSVEGVTFQNTAYECVMIANASSRVRVIGNSFTSIGNSSLPGAGNVMDCINIAPNALTMYSIVVANNTIYNCPGTADGCNGILVEANPTTPQRINSVSVTGNSIDTVGANGIRLVGVTSGVVSGNVIRYPCGWRGVGIDVLQSKVNVVGNFIHIPDGAITTAGIGISIGEGCTGSAVKDNVIIQDAANSGILVTGSSDNVVIQGNDITVSKSNASTRPILIGGGSGTQNRIIVRDNNIFSTVGVEFILVGAICADFFVKGNHVYTSTAGEVKTTTGATLGRWVANEYHGPVTENLTSGTVLLRAGTTSVSTAGVPARLGYPIYGTGTPEAVVTAPVGSLFLRTDGGASTTLYVKESSTGSTGWVAK